MLIILTIAMIAPAFILVLDKRTYNLGLIPSIASAAYTTYSITMSIVNMKKLSMATSIGIIVLIIFIEIYQFILVKSNHGVSKK